jgi:hypothetical protein
MEKEKPMDNFYYLFAGAAFIWVIFGFYAAIRGVWYSRMGGISSNNGRISSPEPRVQSGTKLYRSYAKQA